MKEKIKVIKEYLKEFPNDIYAKNNLLCCEYADELSIELDEGFYPRIEYGYWVVNQHIKVGKTYGLINSATKYEHDGKNSVVIWNASCGRLDFVDDEYYTEIDSEWEGFLNVLKSYNPLDYDERNNKYIYDLEHGKKLIADYNKIIRNFKNAISEKIKEVKIANKKKELEQLQKELMELTNK